MVWDYGSVRSSNYHSSHSHQVYQEPMKTEILHVVMFGLNSIQYYSCPIISGNARWSILTGISYTCVADPVTW